MNRIIRIKSCSNCHHKTHMGGFGNIAYIPRCGLTSKELPYTKHVSGNRIIAQSTDRIPDSCPLEKEKELTT